MAEMFLQLQDVDGESLDQDHPKWIEVKSWEWGSEATVKWDFNQGGQSTNSKVRCLFVNKIVDNASVTLHKYCLTGKHIMNGRLVCRKNDGETKLDYLTLEMNDILVGSVEWAGTGDDQIVPEKVKLEFADFKMHYKIQSDSGNPSGNNDFGFNVQRQKAT